jgi:hypothetical protein
MKRKLVASSLTLVLMISAFISLPRTAASKSSVNSLDRHASTYRATLLPMLVTNLDVDRTDDNAGATACTAAINDCSLRGAIINANSDPGVDPIVINLQPATTYSLTLANATQENAAATGDLDITTTLHSVTILGGGPTTVIDAAGLTSGTMHDRVFQITSSGVTVIFQDLTIRNGQAADDGESGASTNPTSQNSTRVGGGILNGGGFDVNGLVINSGGSVTLDDVTIQSCQVLGKGDDQVNQQRTLDAWGGGLASLGTTGNVIITGSTFTGNTALGGNGGNFNNGNASNAKGGSIYFEGGTLNIDLTRIDNSNATGGNGGSVDPDFHDNGGAGGFAQGGGVWIGGGTATINDTTFESTQANGGNSGFGGNGVNPGGDANGGGLYSLGNTTVTNSTFHLAGASGGDGGNAFGLTCLGAHQAGDGGGARGAAIFADGGTMIINTATLANNSANGGNGGSGGKVGGGSCAGTQHGAGGLAHGGAITNNNAATLNIKHGTISGNNAQAGNSGVDQGGASSPARLVAEGTGGGIRVGPGTVTLENTIIANNTAANGTGDTTGAPTPGPDVDGAVTSNGHNLLGTATEATGFTGAGDLTGANPMLAPLADNGGPTETMELLPGSDAIDAGVASGSTFDQRGMLRTVDDPGVANEATSDGTDIGAYEGDIPCVLTCPEDISVSNDPGECSAVVTYTEPSGDTCGTVTCDCPSGSSFPVGETTVTCTSSVGPTCSFKVTVTDDEDPVITTNGPFTLWPPNHSYATFNVSDLVASVSDNCDELGVGSVVITSVSSDEPEDAAGGGDGNTLNDIVIGAGCTSVQLRAERLGSGSGRVYTITLEVTDIAGNVATATVQVTVPHSQNGAAAVDDGPSYTVSCP